MVAYFEIQSYAGALTFSQEKVKRQRDKFFKGMHFLGPEEILDAAQDKPEEIL